MKKTILALSLSVLSVLGFSAIAQNQNVENKKCENKECCKKEGKKDCKDRKDFGKAQYTLGVFPISGPRGRRGSG